MNEFLSVLKTFRENLVILETPENFFQKLSNEREIDIYLLRKNIKRDFIEELKRNFYLIQVFPHHYGGANYFFLNGDKLLNIDLYTHWIYNFREVLPGNFFKENVIYINGFSFLKKEAWILYFLLKKALKNELCKYFSRFDFENVRKFLKNYKEKRFKILENILSKQDCLDIQETIQKEYILKQPINFKSILYEPFRVVYRVIKPTGLIIAFLGPDGVGKTTLIKEIEKKLIHELPFRDVKTFHLKPLNLKDFFMKKNRMNLQTSVLPYQKQPYKGILNYLKLLQFFLEYVIGFWVKIYPLKVKSTLVIFDRYYDDLIIDPLRYRYAGNIKIANFFRKFLPKPDIYIILWAPEEVIRKRKQELCTDHLRKLLNKYKQYGKSISAYTLDTSQEMDILLKNVKGIILEYLIKRLQK